MGFRNSSTPPPPSRRPSGSWAIRAFLLVCALVLPLVAAPAAADTADEVGELRGIVLEHAAQFRSFRGRYRLVQTSGTAQALQMEFEARIQGEDLYVDLYFNSRSERRELAARWAGVHTDRYDNPDGYIGVSLNSPNWTLAPDMAYMDPRVLFLEIYGRRADDWLAVGRSTAHEREGMRVLSHHMPTYCACSYDVYIDTENRVRRLEYAMRLSEPETEIRRYWDGDLFDVRRLERAWEFDAYDVLDGVSTPTLAASHWYAHDDALSERLWDLRDRGRISELEAWVRNYVDNPATLTTVQTLAFVDPLAVEFNRPLAREDFEIEIPENAFIIDSATGANYTASARPLGRRIPPDLVAGMAVVALIAAGTVAGWWLWRRHA